MTKKVMHKKGKKAGRKKAWRKTVASDRALAAQWHPTKNGDLRPEEVSFQSRKRIWWQCPNAPDHAWSATVFGHTTDGGCPRCRERAFYGRGP